MLQAHCVRIVKLPLQLVDTVLQGFNLLLLILVVVEQVDNLHRYLHRSRYDCEYHGGFLDGRYGCGSGSSRTLHSGSRHIDKLHDAVNHRQGGGHYAASRRYDFPSHAPDGVADFLE